MRDKERTMKDFACIPIIDGGFSNNFAGKKEFIDIRIDRIESMKPVQCNKRDYIQIRMFSGESYWAACCMKSLKVAIESQMKEPQVVDPIEENIQVGKYNWDFRKRQWSKKDE